MPTPPVPTQDLEETAALYRSGLTIKETGKEIGRSYTATRHRLLLAGVTLRPPRCRAVPS
jgi:hypothetical protein